VKRLALVLAMIALPAACASVLGVADGDYEKAVDGLCKCDTVPESLEAGTQSGCVALLTRRLGAASDTELQSWVEAVDGGCGTCASAPTCINTPPICSHTTCGPDLPCCSTASGPVVCNAQGLCDQN
jgi:hypothetical protein